MKKITLLLLALAIGGNVFGQAKSTGNVTLAANMTANLTLNNNTSKARLVLTGPSDRWFALQFLNVSAMALGEDLVYSNGTMLVDANFGGSAVGPGRTPIVDSTNNWTVLTDVVDANTSIRTITAERNFFTGDTNDYVFNYADTSIDFAWARRGSAGFTVNNHGPASTGNRGYASGTFTTLGVEDFSLNAAAIYPNPSKGNFTIETKQGLEKVMVYSHVGAFLKTIETNNSSNSVEIDLNDLQSGVYLIQLINKDQKSWKKIIVE